jgi:hypothetical protein
MHKSTFQYLKPTDDQLSIMDMVRSDFAAFSDMLDHLLPEGADKDHVIRLIRDAAMWANVAITREADGSPRE